MIYQPKNVTPYKTAIDVTYSDLNFSMELSTNNSITAYQLFILDWDNNERYNGLKTVLGTPLYNGDTLYIPIPTSYLSNGNDYKWYVYLYQDSANMLITNGIVQSVTSDTNFVIQQNINIMPGMYFKYGNSSIEISSYNAETGAIILASAPSNTITAGTQYSIYSDFIKTSPEYVLYTRTKPTVEITNAPVTLTTRSYTFNATYSQAEGEPMIRHFWRVGTPIGDGSTYNLVYATDNIYSANLSFTYDGFKSGVEYIVELYIMSEYEDLEICASVRFNVEYNTIEYLEQPVAAVDCDKNAIKIEWVAPTEFAPSLIDNNIYTGAIQPGDIGENSFYIEKGLSNISAGYNIIIGNVSFTIVSYDSITGLLTIEETVPEIVDVGESYTISGISDIPVGSAVELLRNVPYSTVNSVDTKQYSLIYENNETAEGIGTYPDEYNITLQFKPDVSFFYGTTGIFNDINPVAFIESDSADEITGMIIIFIHKYDVCAATPELDGSTANVQQLGPNNTESVVYLATDINLEETPYIYFPNYGYIEKISEYDSDTNAATLNKDLPFAPEDGEDYVMLKTLIATFYDNPQDTWVLQQNPVAQADLDYRWIDDSNSWDDTKYWVEGGTGIERVSNYWWKLQITNTTIKLERGGV